ncbi:MAG: hypothetical protein MK085_05050 [Phycisphaerales bacterium]|nr:hypothetical protein [Phycisphaerales bacterium]
MGLFEKPSEKKHRQLLEQHEAQTRELKSQSSSLSEQANEIRDLKRQLGDIAEQLRRANLSPEERLAEDKEKAREALAAAEAAAIRAREQSVTGRRFWLVVLALMLGLLVYSWVTDSWVLLGGVVVALGVLGSCAG